MPYPAAFWFRLHRGFERCAHFLVEHEQVLDPLAFGRKTATAIEPVYGPVKGLVGLAEIGWHEFGIVEVGQCGAGMCRAGVEYSLCQRLQF